MMRVIKTDESRGEKFTTWNLTDNEKQKVKNLLSEHAIPEAKTEYFMGWFEDICRRHKEYQKGNDNITKVKKNRLKLLNVLDRLDIIFTPPFFLAEDKGVFYGEASKEYGGIEKKIFEYYVDALENYLIPIRQLLHRLNDIEKEHRRPKSNTTEFVFEVARYYRYALGQEPTLTKNGLFFRLIRMAYRFLGWADKSDEINESIHPDKAIAAALKRLSKHKGI